MQGNQKTLKDNAKESQKNVLRITEPKVVTSQ